MGKLKRSGLSYVMKSVILVRNLVKKGKKRDQYIF